MMMNRDEEVTTLSGDEWQLRARVMKSENRASAPRGKGVMEE